MTNFSESKSGKTNRKQQVRGDLQRPLIPAALARTGARQQPPEAEFTMEAEQGPPEVGGEVWSSAEELFWHHMSEVESKWNILKLNDDIWAKLIYFERNRRLAKAYVSTPVLSIDGSTSGLDGFRIGLSGIDNNSRELDSIRCLRSIGLGVKLKIDTQGNILIRRALPRTREAISGGRSQQECSVWVKEWSRPAADGLEYASMRQLNPLDRSYRKLFDMRRFRLELERRLSQANSGEHENIDWRQCVSIISFAAEQPPEGRELAGSLLKNPCWVMIINIIAIDMLKSLALERQNCDSSRRLSLASSPSMANLARWAPSSAEPKSAGNSRQPASQLRASSSAANLFPAPASSASHSAGSNYYSSTAAESLQRPLRAFSRNRLLSPTRRPTASAKDDRSLSSQQLASSTIYTTFDLNRYPKRLPPDYTSDYHSASRSSSSNGYAGNWQQRLAGSRYKPLSRNKLLENSLNQNNLSLSNLELSRRSRSRPAPGIRINYHDRYLSEEEHLREEELEEEPQLLHQPRRTNRSQAAKFEQAQACACCCELTGRLQMEYSHKCSSSSSEVSRLNVAGGQKEPTQASKVSRVSIASSSSSSGCADNDYFLSHSSSSMSCGSTGNERELFSSQKKPPGRGEHPSSSTGNTSDEYEPKGTSSEDLKRPRADQLEHSKRPLRRAFKAKEASSEAEFACKHAVQLQKSLIGSENSKSDSLIDASNSCECPLTADKAQCCNCCECLEAKDELEEPEMGELCNCQLDSSNRDHQDESIYSRLPRPNSSEEEEGAKKSRKNKVHVAGKKRGGSGPSGNTQRNLLTTSTDQHYISTLPLLSREEELEQEQERKLGKSRKQSGGWLAGSKYGKMLPKFIFLSSANNRPNERSSEEASTQAVAKLAGQPDTPPKANNTLDRKLKYRLTRSNLDLS